MKCKNLLIDFLHELGNFKQKKIFTLQNVFFFKFYNNRPIDCLHYVPTTILFMYVLVTVLVGIGVIHQLREQDLGCF